MSTWLPQPAILAHAVKGHTALLQLALPPFSLFAIIMAVLVPFQAAAFTALRQSNVMEIRRREASLCIFTAGAPVQGPFLLLVGNVFEVAIGIIPMSDGSFANH